MPEIRKFLAQNLNMEYMSVQWSTATRKNMGRIGGLIAFKYVSIHPPLLWNQSWKNTIDSRIFKLQWIRNLLNEIYIWLCNTEHLTMRGGIGSTLNWKEILRFYDAEDKTKMMRSKHKIQIKFTLKRRRLDVISLTPDSTWWSRGIEIQYIYVTHLVSQEGHVYVFYFLKRYWGDYPRHVCMEGRS